MRVFLLLASILSFSMIYAQPGGGGGGGQGGRQQGGGQNNQQRERPEMREFKASEMAGIFNYDTDEAIKKIKLKKKNKELKLKVRRALVKYNNKVNEVALLNKDNFDTLNVYMNGIMKANRPSRGEGNQMGGGQQSSRDNMGDDSDNPMRKAMELTKVKLEPARKDVRHAEVNLNKKLESILSEKQNKKWLAYQKKIKDDLKPKKQSNNNSNSGMSRGGGRQGGQGGPPGGGMR